MIMINLISVVTTQKINNLAKELDLETLKN